MELIKNFTKAMEEEHFICSACETINFRVKSVTLDYPCLDVLLCCNECDEEWTEHFNLEYAGYTNSEGKYVESCPNCGASIDNCICREDD